MRIHNMFLRVFCFVVCLSLLAAHNLLAGEMRTWTGKNGKKIEAEYVSRQDGLLTLKLSSGSILKTKISSLSKDDQDFLTSMMPDINTSGMSPVFSKRLQSYKKTLREGENQNGVGYLESVIFEIEGGLAERDTRRQGWPKYEKQSQQLLAYAKREKEKREKAAKKKKQLKVSDPYEKKRKELVERMTPSQKAKYYQSKPMIRATSKERLEHVQRIIAGDEEKKAKDEAIEGKLKNIQAVNADFDKVLFEPNKYEGKVLLSTVQLVGVMYPKYVVVHNLGLSNEQPISSSEKLCNKASRALEIKGQHGVVVIRYTIQNGALQLLDINLPD